MGHKIRSKRALRSRNQHPNLRDDYKVSDKQINASSKEEENKV